MGAWLLYEAYITVTTNASTPLPWDKIFLNFSEVCTYNILEL